MKHDICLPPKSEDKKEEIEEKEQNNEEKEKERVKHGTYGNRQALNLNTNGPFTHYFEF